MKGWLSRHLFKRQQETAATLDTVETELQELQAAADAREPRINSLWNWAMSRRIRNGVGDDFEWDLSNPRPLRG